MDNARKIPPPGTTKRKILHTAILLWLTLLSGCNIIYRTSIREPDYYYLNPHKNLPAIGTAVLVELENDSSYPQISADMTQALFRALQKRQVLSVAVVRQSDPAWRSLQVNADSPHTLDQMKVMQKALKSNAVLVGTVTTYQPYPHMAIGLRLKLVDLTDGQLLWAFEQVWDTTDKTTEKRIKDYFHDQIRAGFAPQAEQLVVVSSLEFAKFVAYEVAQTM